jgi:ABC-2 type transport system ATP-binding protein
VTSPSAPVIDVAGLRKRYGRVEALADLTMTVHPGEVFGFLGPNGAGKTTTVKLLLGLARPSGGSGRSGRVLGAPLGDLEARRRIGYLPELFRYQPWLRAREVLDLHADLVGLPRAGRARAFDEVLGLVGLSDRASDAVSGFSKGMQQRLGLGVALVGDPALVILDEPTSALDPIGRIDVRGILRTARDRGAAVFLNSHLLSEVEVTCDRVAFVKEGRVVREMTLGAAERDLEVELRLDRVSPAVLEGLTRFGRDVREDGALVRLRVDGEERLPEMSRWLAEQGVGLYRLAARRRSLEDVFLEVVA